ncbi:hypothetical protein [Hippea maritima]|uniref:EGF-like domain-containing protein n=1 Tax=Hippea maritima (strain ATCC 700847 / DSM 10411 / MH2) TaxID=760142 RepID=F2LV69_HIPMA|nr:hypothetical protein [Hippea maritima]AEA33653.1 hypothetical protein Hipma_0683 [Hippea maritima DSM 10411]
MRKIAVFLMAVFFLPFLALASDNAAQQFSSAQSTGESAGNYAVQRLGSKSGLKSRIFTPATSGGQVQMHSLNGQNPFNGSIASPGGKKILEILIHPTPTGDLSPVYVYENTGDGNNYNYSYVVPFEVSGICANGLIHCNPGTWDYCKYYMWTTDSSGFLKLIERPSTDFGGCYCINNSCGSNLASNNLSIILKDIGGGAVAAMMKNGNYRLRVTGVEVNSVDIIYYGQITKDTSAPQPSNYPADTAQYEWQSGSTNPSTYYDATNGGYLYSAAGSVESSEESNPNSMYSLIETSGAAQKNPIEQHTCYIKRIVNIDKKQSDHYSPEGDDTCPEVFDTSICNSMSDCYYDETGVHCRCNLKATGGGNGGCGQSFDYRFCGKFTTGAYIYDDSCAVLQIDGVTVWKPMCYWSDGINTFNGSTTRTTNGVQHIFAQYTNFGGCNGYPQSYLYIYIYRKRWDEVSSYIDDQCQAYENDSNCTLKDEWVDSVQTWSNYASTGLVPAGQVCKTFNGWQPHTFCYNWWEKKRIYVCKTQGYNFDKAKQRANTIVNSTKDVDVMSASTLGSTSYQDYREDNGSWGYHSGSLTVPFAGSQNGCMFVCKVKVPEEDTQAYANTNTSQYRSTNSYVFDYRKCADNNGSYSCPYDTSKGETVVTDCQCINEFAEAATIMNTLENAGKDIICSSGTKH